MPTQPQRNIQVAAPGFLGLNTQDSPVGMDITFAATADNCIIDKLGRIASRKGFQALTTNGRVTLVEEQVRQMFYFTSRAGVNYLFVCANNNIYLQDLNSPYELSALTLPVGYPGINADNWSICTLSDKVYFVQSGQQPLLFDPNAVDPTILELWAEPPNPLTGPSPGLPNVNLAAFGHQFCADYDDNKSILVWSDLLIGDIFATATQGGSIDLTEVWPFGYDVVVALYAHNNFLVVFGLQSILVFNVPIEGPTYASLVDTIVGIGCVARDTVVGTGNDVFFLDDTGVRSLGRTITEKSVPIGDVSVNVRSDIKSAIASSTPKNIKAVYHADESFYAVFFPDIDITYVFDTRQSLENGALRPTRWPFIGITCSTRSQQEDQYFAGRYGVYEYKGGNDKAYTDTGDPDLLVDIPVSMSYYTNYQTFEQPANLKFPKQLDLTIIGSIDLQLYVKWGFDYLSPTNELELTRTGGEAAQYNISEYDLAEYSGGGTLLSTETFNLWGNGRNVNFGFEANILGTQLSMQELNIQTLTGRII